MSVEIARQERQEETLGSSPNRVDSFLSGSLTPNPVAAIISDRREWRLTR